MELWAVTGVSAIRTTLLLIKNTAPISVHVTEERKVIHAIIIREIICNY